MTLPFDPIPDNAEAIRLALVEIARTYQAGKPGQSAWPDEPLQARANFVFREIRNPSRAAQCAAVLSERAPAVSLPVGVVLRLLADAVALPDALRRLEGSEREASTCWTRVDSAHRIMQAHGGDYDKRVRKALFELGMTGEAGGKGSSRADHHRIAAHYHALRCGAPDTLWEGQILPPHSHADAVRIIEDRYGIDWDSLRRAWRRKGIIVSTEAEVFPIK